MSSETLSFFPTNPVLNSLAMVVRDFGWRILGRIRRQEGIRDAAVILAIGIGAVVRAHWELDTLADATVADITLLLSLVATKVLCTIAQRACSIRCPNSSRTIPQGYTVPCQQDRHVGIRNPGKDNILNHRQLAAAGVVVLIRYKAFRTR